MTQQTIGYEYDVGGKLQEKRIFAYLPDKTIDELKKITPSDSVNYTYDSAFKDKLVSYDGEAITYDAIGNPLSYRGMTFTWKKGRELNQIQKTTRFIHIGIMGMSTTMSRTCRVMWSGS